ncbi:MAG TPA: 50S ribosomal protein L21, partial [Roseiflexaceae bacterium]|nr:50S ribosomal protein L21 [Roseiflexaceae bacterium]
EVLLLSSTDQTLVGAPTVDGARVIAEVRGATTGDKVVVFKYKNKKRYRRRTGHRQDYTRILIRRIEGAPA